MTDTYHLIVIGAGMAGVATANKCASEGWRVAIVDELPYVADTHGAAAVHSAMPDAQGDAGVQGGFKAPWRLCRRCRRRR